MGWQVFLILTHPKLRFAMALNMERAIFLSFRKINLGGVAMKFPYVCKIPPCPTLSQDDFEKWLTTQAQKGLYLRFIIAGMAILKRGEPSDWCFLRVPDSSKDLTYNGGKLIRFYLGMACYRVFYHRESVPPQKERPSHPRRDLAMCIIGFLLVMGVSLFTLHRGSSRVIHAEWLLSFHAFETMILILWELLMFPLIFRITFPKFRWPVLVEYLRKGTHVLLVAGVLVYGIWCDNARGETLPPSFYESGESVSAYRVAVLGGMQTEWREDCPGMESPWDEDYVYISQFDFAAEWMAKGFYSHFCRDMGGMESMSKAPDGIQWAWTETELRTGGHGICLILRSDVTAIYVNYSGPQSAECVLNQTISNVLPRD